MFDQIILFIDQYALWVAFAIGLIKLFHILLYKGLQPRYIIQTYFTIFSGVNVSDSKNYHQKFRFRQIHNVLTVAFYSFFAIWLIVHLTIEVSVR